MPCVGLVLKVLLTKGRGRLPRSSLKSGAEIARRGKSCFKSDVGHGLVGFFEQGRSHMDAIAVDELTDAQACQLLHFVVERRAAHGQGIGTCDVSKAASA